MKNTLLILFSAMFIGTNLIVITVSGNQPKRGENMFVSNILFTQKYLNVSKMKGWDIVVTDDAIPSEKYAAEEFKNLFLEATGIDLPINNSAKDTSAHVFIGQNPMLNGYESNKFDEEELCVIVKEDMLAIVGGRPRGVLYGVYQFFEDGFGVRFLTEDHTYIPKTESVKLPCGEFRYNPPFSFRWSFYGENFRNPAFAAKLRVNTISDDERIGGRTAQNLIRSIHLRNSTLLSLGEALIKFQLSFFYFGKNHLNPLRIKDVADELKLHSSTISRIARNKYVYTKWGTFPLKFFFKRGIKKLSKDEMISTDKVKQTIREIIQKEDKEIPLRDKEIAEILIKKFNIKIARRTIAKYRKEMNIPSAHERVKKS